MLKHPRLSYFHSRAEHLHAALLEADPGVVSYTPRPFKLTVRAKPYVPDCYVSRADGRHQVITLQPRAEMALADRESLEAFFALKSMSFQVISTESIFEQELKAQNWIDIVRTLYLARTLDTAGAELLVLNRFNASRRIRLDEFIDSGDRERTYLIEIAVLRLLHRGVLTAPLSDTWLEFETEFELCT
ncbi:MAG: hypothetical protein Q8K97_03050 [Pseudohongiella sp.]|nr:hypothetical protein [Pseudohongiella sp.]